MLLIYEYTVVLRVYFQSLRILRFLLSQVIAASVGFQLVGNYTVAFGILCAEP